MLQKLFGFDPTQNKVRTEIVAGITTFLTMAYMSVLAILFVLRYWQKSTVIAEIHGEIFAILILMAISGCIGYQIGKDRKLGAGWSYALGAITGPLGWVIAACSKKV